MKEKIIHKIQEFVAEYQQQPTIATSWGEPIVRFAAADDPLFHDLKKLVAATHALPQDLLPTARTVISFFLPFAKSIASTNIKERLSSPEWAVSYIETNELITQLGQSMNIFFTTFGEKVESVPATHNWIEDKLISNWSHRHVAFVAGLGRFGLNNMLITDKGCSGRIGSLVTTAAIKPDARPEKEACLFKYDGSCRKCVRKCVNAALLEQSFDRFKCYAQLLHNVEAHKEVGYADVCGKCLAAVPCSHANPAGIKHQQRNRRKFLSIPEPVANPEEK